MYTLIRQAYKHYMRKEEFYIIIVGLDNAGKTTLLERIKSIFTGVAGLPPEKIAPTIGLNIGKIDLENRNYNFWDLGGQTDLQTIWPKYYAECHAIIFVVDSTDRERIEEVQQVFEKVITNDEVEGVPVLMLANKQDVDLALRVEDIKEIFNNIAVKLGARDSKVLPCCALSGILYEPPTKSSTMPLDPLDAPAPAAKNVIPPRPIQDDLRIANERYLRAHPEIKEMLDYFVQRCLLERPDSVLTFAATAMTQQQPVQMPQSSSRMSARRQSQQSQQGHHHHQQQQHTHEHQRQRQRTTSTSGLSAASDRSDRSDGTASTVSTLTFELSNTYILPEPFLVFCPFNCDDQTPFSRVHPLLDHLLSAHGIKIQDVGVVAGVMAQYLDHWAKRVEQTESMSKALEEFHDSVVEQQTAAAAVAVPSAEGESLLSAKLAKTGHVSRRIALTLGQDDDGQDKQLRQRLTKDKLAEVLKVQEKERKEEAHLPRKCLFCKTVCDSRSALFKHMFSVHSFNIGLPDNLVYVSHFLDTLSEKLSNLQCLYCERTFKSSAVLRKHMRKKRHFRISPRNKEYDRFYVVNYLEPGKNWETLTSTEHYFSSDDDNNNGGGRRHHYQQQNGHRGNHRSANGRRGAPGAPSLTGSNGNNNNNNNRTGGTVYSYAGTGTSLPTLGTSFNTLRSFMTHATNNLLNGDDDDNGDGEKESWSDWDDEMESEPCQCLFCDQVVKGGGDGCVAHMKESHAFDLKQVQSDMGLTIYQTIILINYIRKATSTHQCPTCLDADPASATSFATLAELSEHITSQGCVAKLPRPPTSVSVNIETPSTVEARQHQVFGTADELRQVAQVVSSLNAADAPPAVPSLPAAAPVAAAPMSWASAASGSSSSAAAAAAATSTSAAATDSNAQERMQRVRGFGDTVVVVKGLLGNTASSTAATADAPAAGQFWSDPQYLFPTYEGDPLLTYSGLDQDSDDEW
ncbi:hypothetical protein RI367_008337 [Sorochytrium milnesiophthora]